MDGCVPNVRGTRDDYRILMEKVNRKRTLERPNRRMLSRRVLLRMGLKLRV
jgi:hypothetical protein